MVSPPKPSGARSDQAGYLLSRVGTAVQVGFKAVLSRWDLRPLHFLVLNALQAGPGSSQQQLCRALHVDSGNMVELLDTLERLGHARRAPDPRDRRRHVVSITPTGRSTLAAITRAVRDYDDRFMAPLDPAERQQLAGLLARLFATTAEGQGQGFAGVP